jgi:hypothetical protein
MTVLLHIPEIESLKTIVGREFGQYAEGIYTSDLNHMTVIDTRDNRNICSLENVQNQVTKWMD